MFNTLIQLKRQLFRKPGALGVLPRTTKPLPLASYVTQPLATAPAKCMPFRLLKWGIFGNNVLGDCVFAAIAHVMMATSRLLGQKFSVTNEEVVASYRAYCAKYSGGKDDGAYPDVVLTNWTTTPMWGTTLTAWADIDFTNAEEIRQVIASYGAMLLTVNLPMPAIGNQLGAHFKSFIHPIWHLTKTPADDKIYGSHELAVVGYDQESFYAVTWGFVVRMTLPWVAKYATSANVLVTPELVAAGKFRGVDTVSLIAGMKALAA